MCLYADATCTLTISRESEARWYLDAGLMSMTGGLQDPPNVHCPVVIAVGNRVEGEMMNYLAPACIEQTARFPKGRTERCALTSGGLTLPPPPVSPLPFKTPILSLYPAPSSCSCPKPSFSTPSPPSPLIPCLLVLKLLLHICRAEPLGLSKPYCSSIVLDFFFVAHIDFF